MRSRDPSLPNKAPGNQVGSQGANPIYQRLPITGSRARMILPFRCLRLNDGSRAYWQEKQQTFVQIHAQRETTEDTRRGELHLGSLRFLPDAAGRFSEARLTP